MKCTVVIARLAALGILLSLAACGDSDTYVSFGGRAGGQPAFCISAKANCAAPGSSLSALKVEEIGPDRKVQQVMWNVEASNAAVREQRQITYGVVPTGWNIRTPALQLQPLHHYRVNGQFYFSITPNGLVLTESL